MLLALSIQRTSTDADADKVDSEIETLAGHAALDVLAHIAARPFDAATAAGTATSVSDLTLPSDFPTGLAFTAATDVDDFNLVTPFLRDSGTAGVAFEIGVSVRYVTESVAFSPVPTLHKEVTVFVDHDRLRQPIKVSRVVSWL